MSKLSIIPVHRRSAVAGCAFEEANKGRLARCGAVAIAKLGNVNLCLEHTEYALSVRGESLELFDANEIQVSQKTFLNIVRTEVH